MPSATGTVERRSYRLTGAAALTIVGTIVGLVVLKEVFVAAHRPISWAVAAVAAAVLLDPIVDRLAVHIRRVPAVLLTFLAIGAIGVGTAYLVFDEVEQALDRLEAEAPKAADAIEDRDDRVGELARDFQLSARVDDALGALDERVTGGEDVLVSTAGTAPAYLVCAILTIFLMTFGPRMAQRRPRAGPGRGAAGCAPPACSARRSRTPGAAVLLSVAGGARRGHWWWRRSRPRSTCPRRRPWGSPRACCRCSPTSGSRSAASRCSCSRSGSDR